MEKQEDRRADLLSQGLLRLADASRLMSEEQLAFVTIRRRRLIPRRALEQLMLANLHGLKQEER